MTRLLFSISAVVLLLSGLTPLRGQSIQKKTAFRVGFRPVELYPKQNLSRPLDGSYKIFLLSEGNEDTSSNVAATTKKPKRFRFLRGGPKSVCEWFTITELGLSLRINPNRNSLVPQNENLNLELGLMKNLNHRYAIGGTFYGATFQDGGGLGIKPRFRWWLTPKLSLDVSPGILFYSQTQSYPGKVPGFTGHMGLNIGDFFALTGQLEAIRYDYSYLSASNSGPDFLITNKGTDVAWYGGAKLGAYPGVIASIVLLGLAIAITETWN